MSNGTEKMTQAEFRALLVTGERVAKRVFVAAKAERAELQVRLDRAIAAQEKAQDARKPAKEGYGKGEAGQKPLKRKNTAIKPPTEYEEQVELFAWADRMVLELPELDLLFATINGAKMPYGKNRNGQRFSKEAMRQKKAGLKNGVPDLILACPSKVNHAWKSGLFIELKRAKKSLSVVSDEQKQWIEKLTARGYLAVICYGAEEAKAVILDYLGVE